MTEQKQEKKLWVFLVSDVSYWGNKYGLTDSDYEEFRFLSGDELITRDEAQQLAWDHECSHADMKGEPDIELCASCEGEGCSDCDDEGGWTEDYSEFVEKNASLTLEEYNPVTHRAVPSERPEHVAYAHEQAVKTQKLELLRAERSMANAREQMKKFGEQLDAAKAAAVEAKLALMKLENL